MGYDIIFADNIPSKVKEQLYAAATIKKCRNICFVYNSHILDSSACPGEKGRSFRKQKK